jgi:hypothetical protein
MTGWQAFFIITGWVVGFLSSIGAQYYLERRRAYRAVRCACHSVEARLTDDTTFPDFHQWSIGVLEVPFFTGIGFLDSEDQKQASEAWGSYQSFDPSLYPDPEFHVVVTKGLPGFPNATKSDAMRIEIAKIRAIFTKFP